MKARRLLAPPEVRTARFVSTLLLVTLAMAGRAPAQAPANPGGFSHRLWDEVLRAHVTDRGRVDYAGLRRDPRFQRYVDSLAAAEPRRMPGDPDRLAFWINAYNALTIHGILSHLPEDRRAWYDFKPTSIKVGGKSLWRGPRFKVAGRSRTLDEIEHEMIRGNPALKDPRIHVALVCAARGCPPLANRAYEGSTVAARLEARMRAELNDPERTRLDRDGRVIRLSRVFDWYGKDFVDPRFTPHSDSLGAFIARYLKDREAARAIAAGEWRIEFSEYDWRLNGVEGRGAGGKG